MHVGIHRILWDTEQTKVNKIDLSDVIFFEYLKTKYLFCWDNSFICIFATLRRTFEPPIQVWILTEHTHKKMWNRIEKYRKNFSIGKWRIAFFLCELFFFLSIYVSDFNWMTLSDRYQNRIHFNSLKRIKCVNCLVHIEKFPKKSKQIQWKKYRELN